jgi:hypothetical protein
MRLMIIGTHPYQTTGYSKVMYNIVKELKKYKDISVSVFGIQKFTNINDTNRSDVNGENILLWDVFENDKEDYGFGTKSLQGFIKINQPDIIMVYNDPNVVEKYIQNLLLVKDRKFKIVTYLDQIFEYQDQKVIDYICDNSDHVFCFTDLWLKNLLQFHSKSNKSVMKHGLSNDNFWIMNPDLCKTTMAFNKDDFLFLNLNRNQTRKRLEITILAFVGFLKQLNTKNAFLILGNIRDDKGVDVQKVFKYELNKAGLDVDEYYKYLRIIPKENVLTDSEVNILYNACDVGVNTCEAEGFGLCSYEHAMLGKPQIVSNIGGLKDFFNNENSVVCDPLCRVYSNNGGDLTGDALIVDPEDVMKGMVKYYTDRDFYDNHSYECLKIREKYQWDTEVKHLVDTLRTI